MASAGRDLRSANEYAENPAYVANDTDGPVSSEKQRPGSLQLKMDPPADATHSTSVDVAGVTISTPSAQKYAIFDGAPKLSPMIDRVNFFIRARTSSTKDTLLFVGTCLFVIAFLVILILYLAALSSAVDSSSLIGSYCTTSICLQQAGLMVRFMNVSVNPCDNFYQYACGLWPNYNPLPPQRSELTVFKRNDEAVRSRMQSIFDSPIINNYPASYERKVKQFYASCTDGYNLMKLGSRPFIDKVLTPCGGWSLFKNWTQDTWDFNRTLKLVHVDYWADGFFFWDIGENPYKPGQNEITLDLGGLTLPWTYYVRPRFNYTLLALRDYIRTVTEMLIRDAGTVYASEQEKNQSIATFVDDVMTIEMDIALSVNRSAPSEDPFADESQMTLGELNQLAPGIDWCAIVSAAFEESGVNCGTSVIVLEKNHFVEISKYLQALGAQDRISQRRILHHYLTWRLIYSFVDDISFDYLHASVQFQKVAYNRKDLPTISSLCYRFASSFMSDAVSALFIRDYFSPRARTAVHEMVSNIRETIKNRAIDQSSWMDDSTKRFAKVKISTINELLAYPDKLADSSFVDFLYSKLDIQRNEYFQNVLNLHKWAMAYYNQLYNVGQFGMDRGPLAEWHHHNPFDTTLWMFEEDNELLVPAGVLQHPLYHRRIPNYASYGSMGSLITSEILHTIDVSGARWLNGSYFSWYSNDTRQRFSTIRSCMRDYLANTTAGPYYVNGKQRNVPLNYANQVRKTINSVGGVRQAFYAYKDLVQKSPTINDKPLPGLGLSADQTFFISYAQTQCFNRADFTSYLRSRLSFAWWPEDVKLNKVLAQVPEFSSAFNCPASSAMSTNAKCGAW